MPLAARLRRTVVAWAPMEAVLALAVAAHAEATRDEGSPYVEHPLRVALVLAEELGISDPDTIMAALLHDVLEDNAQFTADDIARICPDSVVEMVLALTHCAAADTAADPESRIAYLQRFATSPDPVLMIKLSDRLDNLRSLPFSPSAAKRERYVQETIQHLLPLCEGRGGHFAELNRLLGLAIGKVRMQVPSRTAGP